MSRFVHDLITSVLAPALAMSRPDGDIDGAATGVYVGDRRVVSECTVRLDAARPAALRSASLPAGRARFLSTPLSIDDPALLIERVRELRPDGATEIVTLTAFRPVETTLRIGLGCDLAALMAVRAELPVEPLEARVFDGHLQWSHPDGTRVRLQVDGAEIAPDHLSRAVVLAGGESLRVSLHWTLEAAALFGPGRGADVAEPSITADDPRSAALLRQSLDDLAALELRDGADPFYAAGAPWYLTLFGRDSLWAARLTLPLGTRIAAGTLRALARRQGRRTDPGSEEQPGKMLHEVRSAEVTFHDITLAPLYYGSVDATSLWLSLLHDAWRWGMPAEEVAELLPAAERALEWQAAAAGGEFLRYRDSTGHGLTNQGWKDSADSVQFADGTLAVGPVALCEVQAYAHAAAREGADLLDAFDRPGADRWRAWAAQLQARFRQRFWVRDAAGDYPAIALDGAGRAVDTVTSNIGHLLGTGLLDATESAAVVRRLAAAEMNSGFGLRTMSAAAAGFNPLSYHVGSIWPHDTAIVIAGLCRVGSADADALAADLIRGLLRAGAAFDYRFPELFGSAGDPPLPYPASCRPQAWSAAAAVEMLRASLGLSADVPAGQVRVAPLAAVPLGALEVGGITIGDESVTVAVDAGGSARVSLRPDALRLELS